MMSRRDPSSQAGMFAGLLRTFLCFRYVYMARAVCAADPEEMLNAGLSDCLYS